MLRPVYILAAVLLCACALDAAQRKDPLVHVVKRGDTLSGIAARYRVPLAQIYRWNKLKDDAIRLDQRLQVWPPAQPGDWYIVRPGDNLSQIAARFSAPVRRLKTLNPLKGDPYVWARQEGGTLTVYAMVITEDGSYEMQQYDRKLTEDGLDLAFSRIRDGEQLKVIKGTLKRVGD